MDHKLHLEEALVEAVLWVFSQHSQYCFHLRIYMLFDSVSYSFSPLRCEVLLEFVFLICNYFYFSASHSIFKELHLKRSTVYINKWQPPIAAPFARLLLKKAKTGIFVFSISLSALTLTCFSGGTICVDSSEDQQLQNVADRGFCGSGVRRQLSEVVNCFTYLIDWSSLGNLGRLSCFICDMDALVGIAVARTVNNRNNWRVMVSNGQVRKSKGISRDSAEILQDGHQLKHLLLACLLNKAALVEAHFLLSKSLKTLTPSRLFLHAICWTAVVFWNGASFC